MRKSVFDVPGLTEILKDKVRARGKPEELPRPGRGQKGTVDRERVERLVRGAPEVMIKVRRGGKSPEHVQEHLAYIARNGKIEAENERGDVIAGRAAVRRVGDEWDAAPGSGKPGLSKTVNMVLSMPAGTDPERLLDAARAFARERLSNHHYMFALHTPETDPDPKAPPHPHVHISVLAYGFDGRRLNPDKAMLQSWRERFAEQLRDRGIEAEATPRRTRGVVRKRVGSAEWHIERRAATKHEGEASATKVVSKAKRERIQEIAQEFRRGERELKQWESKTVRTQAAIRKQWLEVAAHFKQSGRSDDLQLAQRIVDFVNGMPSVETERMAGKRRMDAAARAYDAQREKVRDLRPPDGPDRGRE